MPDRPGHHHRHRFPAAVIAHAVWLSHRFALSLRDVEELLFERGIQVTYEAIRTWVVKFGARYAAELRRPAVRPGRTWHMDEVYTRLGGRPVYLWRAVDEHGQVLAVLVQERRDGAAAGRFFRRLLGHAGGPPDAIVTDSLASYGAAKARIPQLAAVAHLRVRAAARLNNRVEQSHQPTRVRECVMRRFKSVAVRPAVSHRVQRALQPLPHTPAPAHHGCAPYREAGAVRRLVRGGGRGARRDGRLSDR